MKLSSIAHWIIARGYEASFRQRYSAELEDVVAHHEVTPGVVLDLARGAIVSRVHIGVATSMVDRRRLRDIRTIRSAFLVFCFAVVVAPITQLALYDPAPTAGFGTRLGVELLGVGLNAYLVSAVLMLVLAVSIFVGLVVHAIRVRRFTILRPLLVGPAMALVVVVAAIAVSAITGRAVSDVSGIGELLGVLGLLSLLALAVGAGAAVKRAGFSGRPLALAAIACTLISASLLVELASSVAAIAFDGSVAWTFAPVPFLVAAFVGLAVLVPTSARSALRRG